MLRDICRETNCYAGSLDEDGRPRGRDGWYPVTMKELQVFMACSLYMGMKKLPNVKAYWTKLEEIFYCHVIAGLFRKNGLWHLLNVYTSPILQHMLRIGNLQSLTKCIKLGG